MKKILFAFASVLMLLFVKPVFAQGDDVVNMNITIEKQNDCYVVSFPDSDLFSTSKPIMEVLIDYTNAEVHKGSKTGTVISSSIADGKISFEVAEGGTYYILPVTDYAYAILLSNGDLMFFRSTESYTNDTEYTVTVNSTSYTGRVFAGIETVSSSTNLWDNYKSSIKKVYVASGQIIKPISMGNWFAVCANLTSFDFNGFNLTNCTDIGDLFVDCSNLVTISNFNTVDTKNVKVFENLFYGCTSLPAQTISTIASQIDTSSATLLGGMFAGTNVITLDLSNFVTTNVEYFYSMFSGCEQLTTLDISSFDTSKALALDGEKMNNMFKDCNSLTTVTFGANFKKNSIDDLCFPYGTWRKTSDGTIQIIDDINKFFDDSETAGEWKKIDTVEVSFNTGTSQIIPAKRLVVGDTYGNLPCTDSQSCSVVLNEKEGYDFVGWYDASTGGNLIESTTSVTNKQDHTLYARWSETTYKVIYNSNGGSGSMSDGSRKYSESFTLPTTASFIKEGYTFKGWLDQSDNAITVIPANTASDVTVKANWSENTYKVIYDSNGGSGSMADGSRDYSESFTLPTTTAFTRTGYTFDGWLDQNNKSITEIPANTASDVTVKANWNEDTYKVIYDNNGGSGTMDYDSRKYTESFTLPAAADVTFTRTGYDFDGWTLNGEKVVAVNAFTAGNVTVKAIWKAKQFDVSFDSQGGSTVDPIKVTYDSTYGTLPETKWKGHNLTGWFTEKTGGNEIKSDTAVTITENQTLYAHWTVDALIITLDVEGTQTVYNDFPKGYTLAEYDENYKDPTKTGGYVFKEWNTKPDGTGDSYSKDTAISFDATTTQDFTLYAQFVKVDIKESEIDKYADEDKQAVADVSKNTQADEAVLATETAKVIIPDEVSNKIDDEEVLEALGVDSSEDVELVIETHLKMEINSVESDGEEGINKFVIDITPLYTVKAKAKNDTTGNTAPLMKDNDGNIRYEELHVEAETYMKIYLPVSFVKPGTDEEVKNVWVKHKNRVFDGEDGNGLPVKHDDNGYYVEYDDPNGFSPFEISKTKLVPDPEPSPSPSGSSGTVKLPKTGIE